MPGEKPQTRDGFVGRFGGVFEHSAWIAELTWDRGLPAGEMTAAGLHRAMVAVLDEAGDQAKLDLLNAHPDLAGRLAVSGALTDDSRREQSSAGLDQCSPEEYQSFQDHNAAYRGRFDFPFIMAVKGASRAEILAAFQRRVTNDRDVEFATALAEVKKIALLRLQEMLS